MGTGRIALPDDTQRARAEGEARKVFRLQVALNVLGNEDLHKLADSKHAGAASAHALIKRATEVALSYMNEDN